MASIAEMLQKGISFWSANLPRESEDIPFKERIFVKTAAIS